MLDITYQGEWVCADSPGVNGKREGGMQQFFAEPSWITESEIFDQGRGSQPYENVLQKAWEKIRSMTALWTTYLCCPESV